MPSPPDALIHSPAGYVTEHVTAFATAGGQARAVDAGNPLPVRATLSAAAAAPLVGTATGAAVAGPFAPDLGRAIWLTLSGSWTGTVTVMRSIDGGATMQPLTVGGTAWGSYAANANEAVGEESVAGATWYLSIALSAGTLAYRVQQ